MLFERHHLISTNIANGQQFELLFIALKNIGYDNNDFTTNGMFLPNDASDALASGFSRHSGSHPQYDGVINRVLAQIDAEFTANNDANEALAKIRGLQAYLMDGLTAHITIDTNGNSYAKPLLALNGSDLFVEGKADAYAKMNAISVADVMNSPVFLKGKLGTFSGMHYNAGDQYSGKGTLYDPFLRGTDGKLFDGVARVAARAKVDLPGKSGGIICRLVHLSHFGFESDGRFVAQS
jgi:A nuclease family of the HNH/ENDO VII superfamily with conserved AHH